MYIGVWYRSGGHIERSVLYIPPLLIYQDSILQNEYHTHHLIFFQAKQTIIITITIITIITIIITIITILTIIINNGVLEYYV